MSTSLPNLPNRECRLCRTVVSNNLEEAYRHMTQHVVDNRHVCIFCTTVFKFKKRQKTCFFRHLEKYHTYSTAIPPNQAERYHRCRICQQKINLFPSNDFETQNRLKIKAHYLEHYPDHDFRQPLPVLCIFEGCSRSWAVKKRAQSCFNKHVNELIPFNIDVRNCENNNGDGDQVEVDGVDPGEADVEDDNEGDGTSDPNNAPNPNATPENNTCSSQNMEHVDEICPILQTMYGSLRYIYGVQDTALDVLGKSLADIGEILRKTVLSIVTDTLNRYQVELHDPPIREMREKLENHLADPFHSAKFETKYKREQTFQERENIIQPYIHYFVSNDTNPKDFILMFDPKKLIQRFLNTEGMFQLWEKSKEFLEENKNYNEECLANNEHHKVRYLSIYDGHRIKEKLKKLQPDEKGIVFTVFADDLTLDRGFTKHNSKNKILGIYIFIHLTAHSTTEKCVLLLGMCQSNQITKYNYNVVLEKVVDQLNTLTETVCKFGNDKVKFILGEFIGDSLCMNPLAGLPASFTPHITHPCRQCNIEQKKYKIAKDADEFLSFLGDRRENFAFNIDGVIQDTPLRRLTDFDVGRDLPGDVWHNFHGGAAKECFGIAIKSLLTKKRFTIEELDDKYRVIPRKTGRHQKNPVPPFSKKHWTGTPHPVFQGSFAELSTTLQLTRVAFHSFNDYRAICLTKEFKLLDTLAKLDELFCRNHVTEGDIVEIEKLLWNMYKLRMDLTRNASYASDLKKYDDEKKKREQEKGNTPSQKRKRGPCGSQTTTQTENDQTQECEDDEEEYEEPEGENQEDEEEEAPPKKKPRLKPPSMYNPPLKPKVNTSYFLHLVQFVF